MKANFHHKPEGGLSVTFDGNWNALSLFLESDIKEHARIHIESKKKEIWIGDISIIKALGEGKYEISSELVPNAHAVIVTRKPLLKAIDEWLDFKKNKKDKIVEL